MGRPISRARPTYDQALFRRVEDGGLWHRWDVDPFAPQSVAPGVETPALISPSPTVGPGRWVVRCPFCSSAQLADPDRTTRFLCVDCLNEAVGRQWVVVKWPTDVARIEEALEPRPEENQSWEPGESVKDLLADNALHGIA
jgi:hypothetical protein